MLHDLLEDSEAIAERIGDVFGADICSLVAALSDNGDYRGRKRRLREQVRAAGARATTIYAADKLANASDLTGAYEEIDEVIAERLPVSLWTCGSRSGATTAKCVCSSWAGCCSWRRSKPSSTGSRACARSRADRLRA